MWATENGSYATPGKSHKKPHAKARGAYDDITHRGRAALYLADRSPDRVSLLHKGGNPNMAQRVRRSHRGHSPSSVRQLPILTALHARYPTLFFLIIHDKVIKVNPLFVLFYRLPKNRRCFLKAKEFFGQFDEKTFK